MKEDLAFIRGNIYIVGIYKECMNDRIGDKIVYKDMREQTRNRLVVVVIIIILPVVRVKEITATG